MGIWEAEKQGNAKVNHFNEEVKENKQKGKKHWGAGEVDKGGEGNPRVEKRNMKK